jgi:hypothetical protein
MGREARTHDLKVIDGPEKDAWHTWRSTLPDHDAAT